ncbi:MAG TPA: stimulus-sensing domain-containing protein [Stellaceae bacterium]|nr:stimulus-sensing domain-containing protein [Stellaceae bacterium]
MGLDTATATPDGGSAAASVAAAARSRAREKSASRLTRRRRRSRLSPLTLRILAINVVALALLGGGFFYLGEYQQNLVYAQTEALRTQGQIFAAALGEGAVDDTLDSGGEVLIPERARAMMRRLVEPTHTRARLFDVHGALVGDTRILGPPSESIEVDELPPPDQSNFFVRFAHRFYDNVMARIPWSGNYTPYVESPSPTASDYPEVERAFQGEIETAVHRAPEGGGLVLTAAVPVQYYKAVLGVVLLSSGSGEIEQAVRSVRFSLAELFLLALAVTILLSIYLAGTIVRPLRQLAAAAEQVRRGQGAQRIPDFAARGDEIGELSAALREMTDTIRRRMNAIEHFAADVAHELKNPLTSLRSAVETTLRVDDPEKQKRLLTLVLEDAKRLDRLITDISDASRLDAELSRDERSLVPLGAMLAALVALYRETAGPDSPFLALDLPGGVGAAEAALPLRGSEERLVRVFRNLLDNAISFSPPGGTITLRARRTGDMIRVAIEDEGPGIPEGKLGAIFDRFYSERPAGEDFGTHSGLGLAISKQIVEAHHGAIRAENRYDRDNRLQGARFIVDLPADFTP